MNYVILVVTYGQQWADSETLKSIRLLKLESHSADLVIWDNSVQSLEDKALVHDLSAALFNVTTRFTPENRGLADIYNEVAAGVASTSILIVLDQDTKLPMEYLQIIGKAAAAEPDIDLFLPLVRSDALIVSPGSYRLIKGKHWTEPRYGVIKSKHTVAITSAMAIRGRYLHSAAPAFDGSLSFYGIDTKFMLDYAQQRPQLVVLQADIEHDCALWNDLSADEYLPRFRNLRSAWFAIHRASWMRRTLVFSFAVYSSLKMAVRYRDPRFLH